MCIAVVNSLFNRGVRTNAVEWYSLPYTLDLYDVINFYALHITAYSEQALSTEKNYTSKTMWNSVELCLLLFYIH